MPGIRKAEIKTQESFASESRRAESEAKVAPFIRAVETRGSSVAPEVIPRTGVSDFIAIGERPTVETQASPQKTGLFSGLAKRFTSRLLKLGSGMAPSAPLMIFSFLLRPGKLQASSWEEFNSALGNFNRELEAFDRAAAHWKEGWPLNPKMNAILTHPDWLELFQERLNFVQVNARFHSLESVFVKDASGGETLRSLDAKQSGLGEFLQQAGPYAPEIYLGEPGIFHNIDNLLTYSESILARAYLGEMPAGTMATISITDTRGNPHPANFRVLETLQGGGPRLVVQVDLPKSIGKENIARIEPADVVDEMARGPFSRVLDAQAAETNILTIVGGVKNGALGVFQLQDLSLGRFAYRRHEPNFWTEHIEVREISGARRGLYLPWLNRRPGFEIPVDGMGRMYSIELATAEKKRELPAASRLVQLAPWINGIAGSLLPGDKQVQMSFGIMESSETLALILARNQSGFFLTHPQQIFLVTPIRDLSSEFIQGFYRESYMFTLPGKRPAKSPTTAEGPQGLGPYRSPPPMLPRVQVEGVNDRHLPRTLLRIENNGAFRASQAMRVAEAQSLSSPPNIRARVSLLTHTLTGEQRVRLSGLPSLASHLFFEDIVVSLEDAQKIGAVQVDERGRMFAGDDLHEIQVRDGKIWE